MQKMADWNMLCYITLLACIKFFKQHHIDLTIIKFNCLDCRWLPPSACNKVGHNTELCSAKVLVTHYWTWFNSLIFKHEALILSAYEGNIEISQYIVGVRLTKYTEILLSSKTSLVTLSHSVLTRLAYSQGHVQKWVDHTYLPWRKDRNKCNKINSCL